MSADIQDNNFSTLTISAACANQADKQCTKNVYHNSNWIYSSPVTETTNKQTLVAKTATCPLGESEF